MPDQLVENLSGIVLNQNVTPAASNDYVDLTSSNTFYQEFYLPQNYARGTDADLTIPPLTGFQILAKVRDGYAEATSVYFEVQYKKFGLSWVKLDSGYSLGADTSGDKVWLDLLLDSPLAITNDMLGNRFRIKLVVSMQPFDQPFNVVTQYENGYAFIEDTQYKVSLAPGVRVPVNANGYLGLLYQDPESLTVYYSRMQDPIGFWYTVPNPLAGTFASARTSNGVTPLQDGGVDASFVFRVLALTADDGVDFLGNSYRSAVVANTVDNTSTVSGDIEDAIWMSKPNPSKFAVENLYFDVRKEKNPTYTNVRTGVTQTEASVNLILNPTFEVDLTGWPTPNTIIPSTWAREAANPALGTYSLHVVTSIPNNANWTTFSPPILALASQTTVVAGQSYTFSTSVYQASPPATGTFQMDINWYNSAAGLISTSTTTIAAASGRRLLSFTATAPTNAVGATVTFWMKSTSGVANFDCYFDAWSFVKGDGTKAYFDGSLADGFNYKYDWSGTAHNSTSIRTRNNTDKDTRWVNLIPYPSFELGDPPTGWTGNGSTLSYVSGDPNAFGSRSMRLTATTTAIHYAYTTNRIRVLAGNTYTMLARFLGRGGSRTYYPRIDWYDVYGLFISSSNGSAASTVTDMRLTATAPAQAHTASIMLWSSGTGAVGDYADVDGMAFLEGSYTGSYFDGSFEGANWIGTPDSSESILEIGTTSAGLDDVAAVIDSVLVDPVTPGVFFHIYYTNDTNDPFIAPSSEAEWDNLLWTKVPGTFQANKREYHALPAPITAKFIKIEFSHLQAKSYSPGDFAKPVSYKKHPKWVLDYFAARLNARNALEAKLMHQRVGVVFDGYDLAYNYYLDDLNQEPDQPVEEAGKINVLDEYLNTEDTFIDEVDPVTANKIKLAFEPYKTSLAQWNTNNLLGQVVSITTPITGVGSEVPLEVNRVNDSDLLSLRNSDVAYENDFPAMFFFVTCRHKYREVKANFTHDRAYFVGIRQISFSRENYATQYDANQYIEPAGDLLNIERNDFVTSGGIMSAS